MTGLFTMTTVGKLSFHFVTHIGRQYAVLVPGIRPEGEQVAVEGRGEVHVAVDLHAELAVVAHHAALQAPCPGRAFCERRVHIIDAHLPPSARREGPALREQRAVALEAVDVHRRALAAGVLLYHVGAQAVGKLGQVEEVKEGFSAELVPKRADEHLDRAIVAWRVLGGVRLRLTPRVILDLYPALSSF